MLKSRRFRAEVCQSRCDDDCDDCDDCADGLLAERRPRLPSLWLLVLVPVFLGLDAVVVAVEGEET